MTSALGCDFWSYKCRPNVPEVIHIEEGMVLHVNQAILAEGAKDGKRTLLMAKFRDHEVPIASLNTVNDQRGVDTLFESGTLTLTVKGDAAVYLYGNLEAPSPGGGDDDYSGESDEDGFLDHHAMEDDSDSEGLDEDDEENGNESDEETTFAHGKIQELPVKAGKKSEKPAAPAANPLKRAAPDAAAAPPAKKAQKTEAASTPNSAAKIPCSNSPACNRTFKTEKDMAAHAKTVHKAPDAAPTEKQPEKAPAAPSSADKKAVQQPAVKKTPAKAAAAAAPVDKKTTQSPKAAAALASEKTAQSPKAAPAPASEKKPQTPKSPKEPQQQGKPKTPAKAAPAADKKVVVKK